MLRTGLLVRGGPSPQAREDVRPGFIAQMITEHGRVVAHALRQLGDAPGDFGLVQLRFRVPDVRGVVEDNPLHSRRAHHIEIVRRNKAGQVEPARAHVR